MSNRGDSSLEALNAGQQPAFPAGLEAPRRGPAVGRHFAAATDHHLATLTALDILRSGGNAADATIAASAVNVVTKPHRTHLGGDAFALVWDRRSGVVESLNAGGRAPRRATPEAFAAGIPSTGPRASTVPGLVDSWVELHARHGSRPLGDLLRPAIGLCREGFPVSLHLSAAMESLLHLGSDSLRATFVKDGTRPYQMGETFKQPNLGDTLEAIASDGRDGFYAGRVGRAIAEAMQGTGGLIDLDDLARPTATWHEPLAASYRGCTVYEQALPSQGLVLLLALNLLEHFPLKEWGLTADAVHVMVEATRLAFADVRRYAADPEFERVPADWLLSEDHARELAARIDMKRATAGGAVPIAGDTTSFVVGDQQMAVCYIQSVFSPGGSRFFIPDVGVLMNNRLTGFHLDPSSPNRLEPGKRTVHTLNNFLVVKDGQLIVGGGTPGADFQVQTNLQVITAVLDWGLDLQAAVDTPRWATSTGGRLDMESRFANALRQDLAARGHDVNITGAWGVRACSQVLGSVSAGGWAAASDLRGEGLAIAI